MPKHWHRHSPRIRPAVKLYVLAQRPLPERIPPGSSMDADIRKDGARKPLNWDEEMP